MPFQYSRQLIGSFFVLSLFAIHAFNMEGYDSLMPIQEQSDSVFEPSGEEDTARVSQKRKGEQLENSSNKRSRTVVLENSNALELYLSFSQLMSQEARIPEKDWIPFVQASNQKITDKHLRFLISIVDEQELPFTCSQALATLKEKYPRYWHSKKTKLETLEILLKNLLNLAAKGGFLSIQYHKDRTFSCYENGVSFKELRSPKQNPSYQADEGSRFSRESSRIRIRIVRLNELRKKNASWSENAQSFYAKMKNDCQGMKAVPLKYFPILDEAWDLPDDLNRVANNILASPGDEL